jgi:hypothetical protein
MDLGVDFGSSLFGGLLPSAVICAKDIFLLTGLLGAV